MGDIVETAQAQVEIAVDVAAQAPIERVDVLSGAEAVETLRCYGEADLGARVRLYWEGAEHKGRGRQTYWRGAAQVSGARIAAMTPINAWNPSREIELTGEGRVSFDAITTGNFGGVDLRFDTLAGGALAFETEHVSGEASIETLGLEDEIFEAGGLGRRIRLRRLPDLLEQTELSRTVTVSLRDSGDTPIWVRVQTIDGHVAWSSPLYLHRAA